MNKICHGADHMKLQRTTKHCEYFFMVSPQLSCVLDNVTVPVRLVDYLFIDRADLFVRYESESSQSNVLDDMQLPNP